MLIAVLQYHWMNISATHSALFFNASTM